MVDEEFPVGSDYSIRWNKNRNPRSFAPTGNFELFNYDADDNVIASGIISNLRMDTPKTFTNLEIKPTDSTNGAITSYSFKFSAPVPYEDGD